MQTERRGRETRNTPLAKCKNKLWFMRKLSIGGEAHSSHNHKRREITEGGTKVMMHERLVLKKLITN